MINEVDFCKLIEQVVDDNKGNPDEKVKQLSILAEKMMAEEDIDLQFNKHQNTKPNTAFKPTIMR